MRRRSTLATSLGALLPRALRLLTRSYGLREHDGRNNPTHDHGGHSDTHSTLAEGDATVTCSGSHHADTSNEGLVYSAVVVKDGKKTTVKTTAQTSSTSDTVTVL